MIDEEDEAKLPNSIRNENIRQTMIGSTYIAKHISSFVSDINRQRLSLKIYKEIKPTPTALPKEKLNK